ncbi:glycosyltransferase family 2 protein [Flavobacterium sp.]|uniref:glycosyltransferase family 2 protein n=1 Tax=Flavobacterium sp. TaxID=239 RepID=UPI003753A19F
MEKIKTFSIIIPVYNAQMHLKQCVYSILNQSFKDFEILLINDGSVDYSLFIANTFSNNDNRVIVINKENGGASSARNEGIKNAKGKYILFIDSDDYLESKDLLFHLNSAVEKNDADLILYTGRSLDIKTNKESTYRENYNLEIIQEFNFDKTIEYLIQNNLFPGSAWIFATKSKIIQNNKLEFKTKIIAEDIDWILKVFTTISKIDAVNNHNYIYRKNQPSSVTATAGVLGVNSLLYIIEKWQDKLMSNTTVLNNSLLHILGYYYFTAHLLYYKLPKEEKIKFKARLDNSFKVTSYVKSKKLKLLRMLQVTFGLDFTALIITILHNFKEKLK